MRLSKEELDKLKKPIIDICGSMDRQENSYFYLHATRYLEMLKLLPLVKNKTARLLDLGCFPGHIAVLSANMGYEVHGINNDIEDVKVYKGFIERMGKAGISINSCNVEIDSLPHAEESFDVVICCELLEHLWKNPFHMFKEIFRVLKGGGLLILTTPNLAWGNNIIGLIRGTSHHPSLSRTFHEVFSSILYHRHNREYTAKDLKYFLEKQNKEPYLFKVEKFYHSNCYDADLKETIRDSRGKERFFSLLSYALKKINPAARSTLMVRAVKPENIYSIPCRRIIYEKGLHPVEEDIDKPGITKCITIPFRWTDGEASFTLPVDKNESDIVITLFIGFHGPAFLSQSRVLIYVNDCLLQEIELLPRPEFSKIKLFIENRIMKTDGLKIRIGSDTWKPGNFGYGDSRELGVIIGWDSFLIEKVRTEDELAQIIESFSDDLVNSPFHPLGYLCGIKDRVEKTIKMGGKGEKQILAGWHHLEKWEDAGFVRWTQQKASFYLINDGKDKLYIEMYSGSKELKDGVSGRLVVEVFRKDGYLIYKTHTFLLPNNTWKVLSFDVFADEVGLQRFSIIVDKTRNPSKIVEGAHDNRELGVAVKKIWLE